MDKKEIIIEAVNIKEKDKILESFYEIIKSNNLLALSTINEKEKQPNVCSAYYVMDNEFNLYIWTDPNSRHSKNISKNSKVAVNIYNSHQEWGSLLKGLQISGMSKPITGKESLFAGSIYLKKYLKVSKFIKTLKDFNSKKLESQLYKITINKIKVLDEEKFGKENYKELIVKR